MENDELVGRGPALVVLSKVIKTSADHGEALLILGEAGIGKTACLRAGEAMARTAGHLVLGTVGDQTETNLPFAGLHRLLRPLLGSINTLPGVQRRALLTALGMHEGGGGSDRFVVSLATLNLLREAAEHQAIVIIADDVQWLDDETRHVLAFVTRRLDGHRVALIATSSSIDGLPDFRDVAHEVRLPRLDQADAHRLLALRAPELEPAQRERVVSQAVGNPLALVELARTPTLLDETQPDPISPLLSLSPTLERAFAGRLHELPSSGRDAVLVAAVSSDASLQEILAATALLSSHDVTATVLEAAQSLGLLGFDETRVRFTHPLVRTAIAQKESVSRRQAAHRALGEVITVSSYRRAWHRALGAAEHDDAIAAELEAVTSDSIRRGDTAAAIMALERAAQLSPVPLERGRRLLLAAKHAARLGRPELVARLLGAALSNELSAFDRVRAELLGEDFDGYVIDNSNRVIHLCRMARLASAAGETDLALELAHAAAQRRRAAPVSARARTDMTAVARHLARDHSDARAVAVLALTDPIGHGRTVLEILTGIDAESVTDTEALSGYAVAARTVGHYPLASRLLDRAETELRARGLLGPLARNLCVAAALRLDLGEWDRAAAALSEFAGLSEASMSEDHRASALAATAKAAALRGDSARALELVAETEHSPAARSGSSYLARAQIVRGIAFISSGKHLDAYTALSRVFAPDDPGHHLREQFDAVTYLAEAAVRAGKPDQAREVVERLRSIARGCGAPVLITQLCYARAVLAPDDEAEQHFLYGLASDPASSPWPRARLQLAYGRWLRRQQRVTQSREPLQASLAILQRLGAAHWAEEALAELGASGVPGEVGPDVPASRLLSAQELKIARLAAAGLSNREIGQQLYLSPRTVGSHLYRSFPKLGISTRSQIAARLDGQHAVDHRA